MRLRPASNRSGLTMIELLVVTAILAILILLLLFALLRYLDTGRDARRKSDLERVKIAFEEYYNDNGCYPPPEVISNCYSQDFAPYLTSIPCDPSTNEPYYYVPLADQCTGYRLYAGLQNPKDPDIAEIGCSGVNGCGFGPYYNYGVSVGAAMFNSNGSGPNPSPSASPSPNAPIYVYACDAAGTCNQYEVGHPFLVNCPVTFPQTNCNNQCGNTANRCEG